MNAEADEYLKEVTSPDDLKRILVFEVPRERVEKQIHEIIQGIRREIALPGFRRGKAPLDLVRARFGDTAQKEAIERLIPEAYQKALEKESLRPVLPAEINDMTYGDAGPLKFQIAIELFPKVEIKKYKGIHVKKETKQVVESDIDREIEALRQRLARFDKFDRESQPGDVVVADYWRVGKDGKVVRGSRVANYPFELGKEGMFREFNEGLTGVRKGDAKVIKVTYPDDFAQEDLRGKTIGFGIEVKEIGQRVVPEIDKEFVKAIGLDSVESLRSKVKEKLTVECGQEAVSRVKRDVLNAIVKGSTFEVPEGLVSRALESMMTSYREEYEGSGDTGAEEKLREIEGRLRPLAINVVKEEFVVVEIAERENIVVEDSEIHAILKSIADRAGVSSEEVRKRAADSDEIGRWRRNILKNKVLDFLLEHAEIEE
jgi:trigger factor